MLTDFVDANGNEQDDSGILLPFNLHIVGIMKMETFLMDFRYLQGIGVKRPVFE